MLELDDLIRDTRALLRYQRELGLTGLNVDEGLLSKRRVIPASGRDAGPPGPAVVSPASPAVASPASSAAAPQARAEPVGPLPLSARGAEGLRIIREELGDCQRCKLCKGRTTLVFGVGNPEARLMFVGEGPGRDEDLQGEPFVGKAGQLLTKMILAMGLRREQTYIANVVKCRPPNNRDPEPDEIQACEPFLRQQILAVQPEVIVTLGRPASHTLLRTTAPISRLRGRWEAYEGIPLMPTFHPAYLLRNPAEKKAAWEDLQQVMTRLGLQDPRRK